MYSEFLKWIEILRHEETSRAKQEYYLAQIAAEVAKSRVQFPNQVKISDFLLRTNEEKQEAMEQMDWKQKMKISKAAWAASLGPTLKKVKPTQ